MAHRRRLGFGFARGPTIIFAPRIPYYRFLVVSSLEPCFAGFPKFPKISGVCSMRIVFKRGTAPPYYIPLLNVYNIIKCLLCPSQMCRPIHCFPNIRERDQRSASTSNFGVTVPQVPLSLLPCTCSSLRLQCQLYNSLIRFEYFYSASLRPLLLWSDPDYSIATVSEFTRRSATGNCERRTCPMSLCSSWRGIRTCARPDARHRTYLRGTTPHNTLVHIVRLNSVSSFDI